MIDETKEELASLHALDLLEGSEREAFVAELAKNPELRANFEGLRHAASAVAHLAPEATPPDSLKERILASSRARVPLGAGIALPPGAGPAPSLLTWVPWLAAACLALGVVWTALRYSEARRENVVLREEQRTAQLALEQARAQLEQARQKATQSSLQVAELSAKLREEGDLARFKISTLASMLGNTPEALAVAVWDPSQQRGVLTVRKLPALASEKDYQLWVIDKQYPNPVNAGVFVVDPVSGEAHIVFKTDKHVDSIAKFAVSLERKGGVPKAEGPIVLLSP